jgi:hypothetical protein
MSNSWIGVVVRRGRDYGEVIDDSNHIMRILTVKMANGNKELIRMHNFKDDPIETKEWEWFCITDDYQTWYRF